MSAERAGVHASYAFDREQAYALLYPLLHGKTPKQVQRILDALEAYVVPDPRLARIEALLDEQERTGGKGLLRAGIDNIRAILRGDQ